MTQPDIDLTGIGEHKPCPKRGILVFSHLPDAVQNAEDSTAWCDYENRHWRASVHRTRPATPTERALLSHALSREVPDDLQTRIRWLSDGVRNRSWPELGITQEGVVA